MHFRIEPTATETVWLCEPHVLQARIFFNYSTVLTIYLMGREGPSRFLFNTISFSFSSILCILAGLELFRKSSFALLALPPSSRLNFALGDADLHPPAVVLLELFRRGNPFLMSLRSRSTMQPSCSSSKGRGLPLFTPVNPALAFFAASSSRFFSRALRFSSWIRNCSFSWNEKDEEGISNAFYRSNFENLSLQGVTHLFPSRVSYSWD